MAKKKIRNGETVPLHPSDKIDDAVRQFLEKCWGRDPSKRPSTALVCETFSQFCSLPQMTSTSEGQSATGLPGKIELLVHSMIVHKESWKRQQFSVKFKYGNRDYTTSLTSEDNWDDHIWFAFRPSPPSLPSLSLAQGQRGELVGRKRQPATRSTGPRRIAPSDEDVLGKQVEGLRDRETLRKPRVTAQLPSS